LAPKRFDSNLLALDGEFYERCKRRKILCIRDTVENYLLFDGGGMEATHPRVLRSGNYATALLRQFDQARLRNLPAIFARHVNEL
jgi:hypothetical protein